MKSLSRVNVPSVCWPLYQVILVDLNGLEDDLTKSLD